MRRVTPACSSVPPAESGRPRFTARGGDRRVDRSRKTLRIGRVFSCVAVRGAAGAPALAAGRGRSDSDLPLGHFGLDLALGLGV